MPSPKPISTVPFDTLEKEYQARKQLLADAEEKKRVAIQAREAIQKEIDALDQQIAKIQSGKVRVVHASGAIKEPSTPTVTKPATKSAKTGQKTLNEYALDIMKKAGKPMSARDLSEKILSKGYKTVSNADTFRASVSSALLRDKRFVSVGRGMYNLADATANSSDSDEPIVIDPPRG